MPCLGSCAHQGKTYHRQCQSCGHQLSCPESAYKGGVAPIEVLFSEQEPHDAYVAVHEHGYWFYIGQRDGTSKRTFSFLQLLLNLAETSVPDATPVFTISN